LKLFLLNLQIVLIGISYDVSYTLTDSFEKEKRETDFEFR